jgi:predicted amidohydrolase YtcJ
MATFRTLIPLLGLLVATNATSASPSRAPDTIYFNGIVHTVDEGLGTQTAFAVSQDRIVAVGPDAQVLALAGKATRQVDLGKAAVIPGLSDNHDHFWNTGKYLVRGVDLVGVSTRSELDSRLQTAVAKARPGEVVSTTVGWVVQPMPTRADLDRMSSTTPIALISSRRAVGVLNSAALQRLGISKGKPDYKGVRVPVDAQGEPTGQLPNYPWSVLMVDKLLPPLTPQDQERLLRQAMQERNALGITSVRELAVFPQDVRTLQRLRKEGKFTVRVALGVEFPEETDLPAYIATQQSLKRDDPWLFVDSLSEEPWAPGTVTAEEFTRLVRAENRSGWRPAPHSSSDRVRGTSADAATEQTLDAYEAANADSPILGKRWYLEHVPFATPAQMDRMAALGLIISTQDYGFTPVQPAPLPPDRMAHWNPIRGFLDHKLLVIGGDDYNGPNPVDRTPNNPMIDFYYYVTRRNRAGQVLTPTERISREEALRIFTVNPAYATFQETQRGKIAPGMLADFVILNQDVMAVPEERILATRPLATFVGGRKVYAAAGSGY